MIRSDLAKDACDARPDLRGEFAELFCVETVYVDGVTAEHRPNLGFRIGGKSIVQELHGVRPRSLEMGIIRTPHVFVDPDLVAVLAFVRVQERGAEIVLGLEILGQKKREVLG